MVDGTLFADTIVSATDAWAVGFYDTGSTRGSLWATAPSGDLFAQGITDLSPTNVYMVVPLLAAGKVDVYHYNGTAWSVDVTNVPFDFDLTGFAGSQGSDFYGLDSTGYNGIDHWNGSAWSRVGTFDTHDQLGDVAEGGVGTVWSDGYFNGSANNAVYVAKNGSVRPTRQES